MARTRKPLPELERRRVATEKTKAKYRNRAFDWKYNRHCIALAAFQARRMGHRPPPLPRIRSMVGAKKALKARKCDSVIALLDRLFVRIAPAEMRLGDLCAVPGEGGMDAVFVNVGPRKAMGWREDAPVLVVLDLDPAEITAAWRL